MKMPQKPADLNHFPTAAAPAAEFNKRIKTYRRGESIQSMIVSPLSKEKLIQIRIQKNEEASIKDGSNHNESGRDNKSVDAENDAGSRVLLAQHPRPSLISGHDSRYAAIKNK